MQFELGDHLISWRTGYTHHGIYIGSDQVIHYSGLADGLRAGPVEITTLKKFAAGKDVKVRKYDDALYSGDSAVRRARSRLGENNYDLQANNCEHFCTWVRTGEHASRQVQLVSELAGAFGAGVSEYRKQRFHKATVTEAAFGTAKATAKSFLKGVAPISPVITVWRRLK
jgi:hypothetical protein